MPLHIHRICTARANAGALPIVNQPTTWTAEIACALQSALRMSQEAFAQHLGIAPRTVAMWHAKGTTRPKPELQQLLDSALFRATPEVQARFAQLTSPAQPATVAQESASPAAHRLATDPDVAFALDWLDGQTGWSAGTARHRVAERLVALDVEALRSRGIRRGQVSQRAIAEALASYYGTPEAPYGLYRAKSDVRGLVSTSILTRPDWLDLDCPLNAAHDRLTVSLAPAPFQREVQPTGAVQRLAETLALDIRMTARPVYRLTSADAREHHIGGTLGTVPFAEYALTMDLLEGELVDALATGQLTEPGALPLRDAYLPDVSSVLNLSGRLCGGGALALCAFARPADPFRGPADYVLMVQERSGHVVNAARRLAVIPKGFHEPLTDIRADAQIGATLRREMEEELFGRDDVDSTTADQRRADPMHPSRLSDPMRWLLAEPDRLRMECTGFGLNLVSGNYEFAGLVVVDDEEFWARFGGLIEANWEASRIQLYSAMDPDLVAEVVGDVAWSNEGLFAMTQGLHRLTEIGGDRVNLPPIEWETT